MVLESQCQQFAGQLLYQTLQGVVALTAQRHEIEHVLLDLQRHVTIVFAQQGEHLLLVPLITVENIGYLPYPVYLGTGLIRHVGETAIQRQSELAQHMFTNTGETGDTHQQIIVYRSGQGIEHGGRSLGWQEGQQHSLHLGMFVAEETGQHIGRHPLQALDILAHHIAVQTVEQTTGESLPQSKIERLFQILP